MIKIYREIKISFSIQRCSFKKLFDFPRKKKRRVTCCALNARTSDEPAQQASRGTRLGARCKIMSSQRTPRSTKKTHENLEIYRARACARDRVDWTIIDREMQQLQTANLSITSASKTMRQVQQMWRSHCCCRIYDSCGVRTHALADWRLKPAP